jgi:hypothetical protein
VAALGERGVAPERFEPLATAEDVAATAPAGDKAGPSELSFGFSVP